MAPDRGARRRRPQNAASSCASGSRSTRGTRPSPIRGSRARCGRRLRRSSGADGLAADGQRPEPIAWQDPRSPTSPGRSRSRSRRPTAPGSAPDADAGLRHIRRPTTRSRLPGPPSRPAPARIDAEIRDALHKAERHRPITDDEALALFRAEGDALDALCRVADDLRAEAVGARDHLRHQPEHQLHERLLRRVPFLRVRPARGRPGVLHPHAGRGGRSSRGRVARRRDRGVHARRDPSGPARLLLWGPDPRREGARPPDACPCVLAHGGHGRRRQTRRLARRVPRGTPRRGARHDARNRRRDPR